jgi:phosphate starvation-inducible PhoH-like protein
LCQSTFCSTEEKAGEKEEKKRGRKPRKMNEKELIQEYLLEPGLANLPSFETRKSAPKTSKKGVSSGTHSSQKQPVENTSDRIPESALTVPRTPAQEVYVQNLKNPHRRIVLATGPAGTGKTVFACEYGLHLFFKGVFDKIIFTRPLVSVDEEFGFLPGTMEEKMAPWVRPIYDVLVQYIPAKEIQQLMDDKTIEIIPLGFMRGRTFKRTWIVADEMQNSTANQMKMLLTRIGQGSKMVLTGDLQQCDHTTKHHYKYGGNRVDPLLNGLDDFLKRFYQKKDPEVGDEYNGRIVHYEFGLGDIQREQVVKDVLNIYG